MTCPWYSSYFYSSTREGRLGIWERWINQGGICSGLVVAHWLSRSFHAFYLFIYFNLLCLLYNQESIFVARSPFSVHECTGLHGLPHCGAQASGMRDKEERLKKLLVTTNVPQTLSNYDRLRGSYMLSVFAVSSHTLDSLSAPSFICWLVPKHQPRTTKYWVWAVVYCIQGRHVACPKWKSKIIMDTSHQVKSHSFRRFEVSEEEGIKVDLELLRTTKTKEPRIYFLILIQKLQENSY